MTGIGTGRRLIGVIGAVCTLTAPVTAAERPSFDCSKAASASEHAICANDRLARLDRAIADAFVELRRNPDLAEELPKEQTAFLARRDACGADTLCLAREMESRRAALALEPLKGSTDERERFVGRYRGKAGDMMVRRTLAGEFEFFGSTAEPNGRWTCDVWGTVRSVDKDVATVKSDPEDGEDAVLVYLKLRGNVLVVTEDEQHRLAGTACGHNGTVDGTYTRTSRRK